jgi:TonB-dependent SusC/RagA subfamily outer membrane receptor
MAESHPPAEVNRSRPLFRIPLALRGLVVLIAAASACGSPAKPRATALPEASAQSTPGKSLADLFRGKAGVTVTEIGDGVRLRIRGSGEIHAEGGDPLFVIDGAPINPPNGVLSMNPNDIVSIEILKDLAQTSIYGINGVNGVVRITTKRR